MSAPTGLAAGSNPSWSLAIWNKVHRYRCLLTKYWWVLLLTLSVALCVTAYFQMNKPVTFASSAKLSVNQENKPVITGDGTQAAALDPETMLATQIQIMQTSSDVRRLTGDMLQASHPGASASPVSLDFSPKNTILNISATGKDPHYTQWYLQATIDAYFAWRKQQRDQAAGPGLRAVARPNRRRRREAAAGQRGAHPVPARRREGLRHGRQDQRNPRNPAPEARPRSRRITTGSSS